MKALLLPALAGLALTGSPAVAQEMIAELSCHAVSPDGSERTLLIGRPLLDRTAADGQFHLNRPGNMEIGSILCVRTTPVPAPHDYEILLDGFPLYISSGEGDDHTLTLLEIADHQFRIRIIEGSLSTAERALAAERLEQYTAMVNSGT